MQSGSWYGDDKYFGLHYDFHAGPNDFDIGSRCGMDELVPMLKLMGPEFVQTDCKGHGGYTSWFSRIPEATVPPHLEHDALAQWRAATSALGLPLHCHYSGIWDKAAGARHPEWCVVPASRGADPAKGQDSGTPAHEKMCPRSPYLEKLMIPQMLELIDRYNVDGFWVDGDLWAVEPCYCPACRKAWTEETGLAEAPVDPSDPRWPRWWKFTRDSFYTFVRRYCDAVHAHKPGVLVCSNWLQTFKNPGDPTRIPTDWISGDNTWVWGLDGSRCEARFLSTRQKPWDIMLWAFYASHGLGNPLSPREFKPPQMLMQEAAVLLSFGGNVQIYEHSPVRDGRLVPWRMRRLREVGEFVKARRELCQHTETIPQIVVLHSEKHLESTASGPNLMWNVDVSPVQGALYALLESSYGVDVMDEWALLPRLADFPLVVAPEQGKMSDGMVAALKAYVENGGSLLVTGAEAHARFGEAFLGFRALGLRPQATFSYPAGDGDGLLYSDPWLLGEATGPDVEVYGRIGHNCQLEDRLLPNPAAVLHRVGKGKVAYVPARLGHDFEFSRFPQARKFFAALAEALLPDPDIRAKAPACIDVALRRRGTSKRIHFVNRISGIPNQPNNGVVDEIPRIGPLSVRMKMAKEPSSVTWHLDEGEAAWTWKDGVLEATVPSVWIHGILVVEE
ncbi:MAG: alpha-L-fucosidase [Kiritimatiellia bacterium]|jgi:hypothetical protein